MKPGFYANCIHTRRTTDLSHTVFWPRGRGQLAAATAALRGAAQPMALAALSQEIAQIRTAWRRAVHTADAESISQSMNGLLHVYDMRSWFSEGADLFGVARTALEPLATNDPAVTLVWARLLAREAWFVFHRGQQQSARSIRAQCNRTWVRSIASWP